MGLILGILSCSTDLYFCFCVSTILVFFFFLVCFRGFLGFFVLLFRATPMAHASSQARGQIGATAVSPHCSEAESKPHLPPTPQLMAMLKP